MSATTPLHVLYDAHCGFCTRWIRWLARFDTRHALVLHDLNDRTAMAAQFPTVDSADLQSAMYAVTPDGRAVRGFYAVRRILAWLPWLWPLLVAFYLPGAALVGPRLYAWVARNRGRLTCGAGTCAFPAAVPPPGPGPVANADKK